MVRGDCLREAVDFHSRFNDRYGVLTRRILREVSENARISISDMSRKVGTSRWYSRGRIKKLDAELGIRYTIEPNESKLGLSAGHLILVKFKSRPDYEHIAGLLGRSYIPQLAASVKGNYDMLVYAIATSSQEYARWDKGMQVAFSQYKASWQSSEVVHRQLGFFPLRNELIEHTSVPSKYKELLKALNSDSRASFQSLAKKLGMHFNTVAYGMNRLLVEGYVKRFTITMDKPDMVSLMSFFAKYSPTEGYEDSSAEARKSFMSDDENSVMSRYLITAPLIGGYDFFTLGAFDDKKTAYREGVLYHKRLFEKHGIRMRYGEIEKVILGSLPIRSINTKKEYATMKWTEDF